MTKYFYVSSEYILHVKEYTHWKRDSMNFSKLVRLCSHHHHPVKEHFHYPKNDLVPSYKQSLYLSTTLLLLLLSHFSLCDPRDGSPPGSPVPGILQARTLEWLAVSFSNAWKWKVKVKSLSRVRLPATPWTAAHQAPPSVGFSRQEYWSGVSVPSPFSILLYWIWYL